MLIFSTVMLIIFPNKVTAAKESMSKYSSQPKQGEALDQWSRLCYWNYIYTGAQIVMKGLSCGCHYQGTSVDKDIVQWSVNYA